LFLWGGKLDIVRIFRKQITEAFLNNYQTDHYNLPNDRMTQYISKLMEFDSNVRWEREGAVTKNI
jgi:hypothetical protein